MAKRKIEKIDFKAVCYKSVTAGCEGVHEELNFLFKFKI